MNVNDKYIVELAKASIFDKAPANPQEGIDWNYIFRKANEQNIVGLLYCAVSRLDEEYQPADELMARWNKLMLTTMGVMTQRYYEFQRMSRIIADKGIRMIGLKGCIIRNLYPVPELRNSKIDCRHGYKKAAFFIIDSLGSYIFAVFKKDILLHGKIRMHNEKY